MIKIRKNSRLYCVHENGFGVVSFRPHVTLEIGSYGSKFYNFFGHSQRVFAPSFGSIMSMKFGKQLFDLCDGRTDRQMDRQMGRENDRQRQADRQTGIDRQAETDR